MTAMATRIRLEGGLLLGNRDTAAMYSARHVNLVRRHCEPVACDVRTKALLFDLDAVCDTLRVRQRRVNLTSVR